VKVSAKHQPDIVVADAPEVVAEKLRLAAAREKILKGALSGTDLLREDRWIERERELAQEGF
jgi:hypothetical protein